MNWKLLRKYVDGSCNEKELDQLGAWLREDSANEDFFISFIEEWDDSENIDFEIDARVAWNEFKARKSGNEQLKGKGIQSSAIGSSRGIKKVYQKKATSWGYSIAAIILLGVGLFWGSQFIHVSEKNEVGKIEYQKISTEQGERSKLKLSDGTIVILNSSSTLRIPMNFGQETRTIELVGEAFFEVTHDEELPFIVISNGLYAKDLGTKFNVSAYDSTGIEVAVEEGLVSMGRMNEGELQKDIVELTPDKLGVLNREEGLTVSDIDHMDTFTGWTQGKLVFRKTPFLQVVNRLERWYDAEFIVKGSGFEDRTLTATYDNMSMEEVLKVVSLSMSISYTHQGKTVTISNRNS